MGASKGYMRKRHIELITALAEGSLDDETEARALIESSPEAKAEYERQRLAIRSLGQLEPAALTEAERSAMRRDIWTAYTTPGEPIAARMSWYARWSYAAAALLLVVGMAAVLTQLGGGEAGVTAFEEVAQTLGLDGAGSPPATEAEPTADQAASETTEAASRSAIVERLAALADMAREGTLTYSAGESALAAESDESRTCLQEAGLPSHIRIGVVTEDEASYVLAIPQDEELGPDTEIVFVDFERCEVVHRDR